MTTYVGVPFEVASIGGNVAYGATMTRYGGFEWKLHDFGPGGGMGAPGIKPAKIKKWPMLTLGGALCTGIKGSVIDACALSSPNFGDNSRVAQVGGGVTCTYGNMTHGFSTSGCVGSRLTISGTSNALVTFSLDMFGKATATGGVSASGGDTADFYPFELGSYGDALLGFTLTVDTGLVPVFAMNSQGPDGWVNLGDVGATCTLQMMLSDPSSQITAADAVGVTNSETITLASPGGGSLGIAVTGYYSAVDRAEVAGITATAVTLSGFGSSMVSLS